MRVLLCAATEMEIAPAIQALSLIENHSVDLLITGVGLLASTYALTRELTVKRPEFILQAGVAGSLQMEQQLAQVVTVQSDCVGDLGVRENGSFQSLFDLKLLGANTLPWTNERLVNSNPLLATLDLPLVNGITVNEITTNAAMITHYREKLNVQIESMEGAALHYVALLEKIPFLQLRALSNLIGERDKAKWQMKEAITHLNRTLQGVLTKLEAI